jgi:D-alanine-D-alanine ligase-like ATP-grasp enzyme
VVFNLVSGDCGEDGSIQQMMNAYGIPRTGSGELASRVCYGKVDTAQQIKVCSR